MVGKALLGSDITKERPVFIPPRKRQTSKKSNGTQNYVDHIVAVQNRQKLSPSSDDLLKTSLILKNKQPLPEIPFDNEILTGVSDNNIYESECNELHHIENKPSPQEPMSRESTTVTPSKYSESSLNTKLSKSQDCLSTRSSKKRVNIRTDNNLHIRGSSRDSLEIANSEDLESGQTSVLNTDDHSLESYNTKRNTDHNYLTMTGTIKRGRKKGQCVDLQINISREELEQINATAIAIETKKKGNLCCSCSLTTGFHIFLLSLICLPFVTLISGVYSFYIGTLTWYNMFNYFNEEAKFSYRFFMSPLLILTYPVGIIVCTVGLGLYAGFVQVSLQFNSWMNEIFDIEKGFYGWVCSFLRLSDCSPYEVVILTDIRIPEGQPHINTSIEELSL